MKQSRKSEPIKMEVVEGPEMTEEEVEAVAQLLAKWLVDDLEKTKDLEESTGRFGSGYQP